MEELLLQLGEGEDAAAEEVDLAAVGLAGEAQVGPGAGIRGFGGDDAGATALGVYSRRVADADPDVIYVINRYRSQTTTPEEAVSILSEIENAARIRATCIANNSHLKEFTTASTVEDSLPFAERVSELTGLPLRFTTVPSGVDPLNKVPNMYPVSVYVRAPWEKAGNRIAEGNR